MTLVEKGQSGGPGAHRDRLAAIGKAIRLRRVELDLKRAELAGRAGLSYAYVAEIENGTKQASSKALWALGSALGLEPHELMALAALIETPERGGESLERRSPVMSHLRRLGVAASTGGERRASWFHLTPDATVVGADPGDAGEAAGEPAGAGLPDLLARLEVALDGVPEDRAELALMLALDERRTRRIVREELDRRPPRD